MIFIRRASPEDAGQLTRITIASKRHWNYPENWIQQWLPALTISPEYISENEVWLAVADEMPAAYYSLLLNDVVARSGATKQSPSTMRGLLQVERFATTLAMTVVFFGWTTSGYCLNTWGRELGYSYFNMPWKEAVRAARLF